MFYIAFSRDSPLKGKISRRTVARRIRESGLKFYRKAKKPMLTKQHRRRRLLWCKKWLGFDFSKVVPSCQMVAQVMFTDEKRFVLRPDGHTGCYRLKGFRLEDRFLLPRAKYGGGGIMVWGAIMKGRIGPLVWIKRT